ncbi:MAG TPA: low temperature requirement protein A [Acidimicrobiia bacterium]|nr:low temperature requirement protein A [Acidimicrobiia bacterium]
MSRIAPPRLQTTAEGGHRTATWLELFYDLAFVVAIAILGERLLDDTTWTGFWSFFGYFALLWWLWASHTFYADRYDTDDLVYRLWAAAQMVAVLVMAASLAHGPSESTTVFAAGYAGARLVLLALYWRVYRHVAETRRLVTGYLIGFGAAAVVWVASVFVPDPARFVLWGIALAIDLATPWVVRRQQATVPLDESHLPERFGLFVILVLGESLAAVVAGLSHIGWTTSSLIAAVLGVLLATLLWWLYFDNAEGSVVRRRNIEGKTWRPTGWIYSHLPLAAALAIVGVALDQAILSAGAGPMPPAQRWLLLGGVALALVCLAILQIASLNYSKESVNRVIAINRLAGVPFLALIGLLVQADPVWVLAGATGVCVAVLAADMVA